MVFAYVCVYIYLCNMNVHMKNIQIKYKLNFKTMKKGLLTILTASLLLVGCQNYDDQFDDLNAQISALKSQVDGLSAVSAQITSLSGTISALQSGVSAAAAAAAAAETAAGAATTAANAATTAATAAGTAATAAGTEAAAATAAANAGAAASAIDYAAISAGLTSLEAKVAEVSAAVALAADADDIAALQAELDAIEADIDELLVGSGVYTSTLQITNQALLAAANALGNGINVISGGLNINVTSDMNMTTLQSVIDKVYNVTGHVTYTNALTTAQTAVTFDKLTSAADIHVEQKGAYSFATLTSASDIWLGNDNSDDVSSVNLGALTTVDNINTGEADAVSTADGIVFDQATSIDLGAMVFYTGGDLTFTTKTGGSLDIASLTDTTSAAVLNPFDLTVTGPATLTLTKLKGDDLGTDEGGVTVSKVATFSITGFGGDITVGSKVNNATINDASEDLVITNATDLESLTIEGVSAYGKAYDALSATSKAAYALAGKLMDLTIPGGADDLTSLTLTGKFGTVNATGQANLSSVTANAAIETLTLATAPDLTTVNLTGSTINSVTVSGTGLGATTLDYTHKNTAATTAVKYGSLSVTDNLDMTSLTSTADDMATLTITGNDKLTALSFTKANSIGTGATAAAVNIYDNDLTAVKSTDTYDTAVAAAATKAHTTADTGSYDNGTSGMAGLQTYLDAIVAATSTATSAVFFDAVTTELVGALDAANDTTTTPGDASTLNTALWTDAAMATSADDATQHFAVLYLRPDSADGVTTYAAQVVDNQVIGYSFQTNRNANTLLDTDLGTAEGFVLTYGTGLTVTADDGDTDTDATNGTTVETISDLVTYLNNEVNTTTSAVGTTVEASRVGGEQTYFTVNYLTISGTNGAVATASAGGQVNATFGSIETGKTLVLSHTFGAAFNEADLASALMADIEASNLYNAASVATADGRANRFVVTRNISQTGYATVDKSPLAVDPPALTILAFDSGSTTVKWAPNSFTSTFGTYSQTRDNAAAIRNLNGSTGSSASAVVDLYVNKTVKTGLTLRLKNTGSVAFAATVGAVFSTLSNTAIVANTAANTSAAGGGLLADGTNIISSSLNSATGSSTASSATVYWVASYASVGDGTPSTSSSTTAAVTCDRTSWLA
jgi:trimeric autotransporter adhesin